MKRNIFYKFLVLALLVAGGWILISCEKDPPPPDHPTNYLDSNDLTGVWDWVDTLYLHNDDYLYITFDSTRYSVRSHFMYHISNDSFIIHQGLFYDHEIGKYRIENGNFYKWDVDVSETMGLPDVYRIVNDEHTPHYSAKRNGDTLTLRILYSLSQVPNEYPSQYTFVKR